MAMASEAGQALAIGAIKIGARILNCSQNAAARARAGWLGMWAVYRPPLPVSRPGPHGGLLGRSTTGEFHSPRPRVHNRLPARECVVRGRAPRMAKRREGGPLDSENIAVPHAVASAVVRAVAWTVGRAHSGFSG